MNTYALGFAFNDDGSKVVLIKKNRPKWQAGLFNGVGGKVEDNECVIDAMIREFMEETTVITDNYNWIKCGVIAMNDAAVHVFCTKLTDGDMSKIISATDEQVHILDIAELYSSQYSGCINNLPALISISRLILFNGENITIDLYYSQ